MNRPPVWVLALRTFAIVIAIAAAIDPSITSRRVTDADISIIAVDPGQDSATAARVARMLGKKFTVTTAALASADATVLVGDRLPDDATSLPTPIFAVTGDRSGTQLSIEGVTAPASVPLNARAPVAAMVHAAGMRGARIIVSLRAGNVEVDRAERSVASNDERIPVSLLFTPTALGIAALQVSARTGNSVANADLALDVRDERWSVLFYDARPSWQSTFVRRAIEGDNRFVVTSRVVTSRNVSTSAGSAPASLDDPAGLARYDAVVIGAPDALSAREVTALESVLRRRAASVVLLLDQKGDGPYQRLTSAPAWRDNGSGRVESIAPAGGLTPGDSTSLRAAEITWPAHLPSGAEAIAFNAPARGDSTPRVPVIWRVPVGAGRVIVSGALDAWRYRDSAVSAFDPFWRTLIADAASATPSAVSATLSQSVLAPDESLTLSIVGRDAMLQPLPVHATATATWQSVDSAAAHPIRLWPGTGAGEFTGTVRAPANPGSYRVAVLVDGHRATAAFTVLPRVSRAIPDERALLDAWTRAHGGQAIGAGEIQSLPAAIQRAIHHAPQLARWYPMRSIWWLFPFVLALSGEWWWRRRNGRR